MSTTTATKSKIEPHDPKHWKKELKRINEFLKKVADGIPALPPNETYTETLKVSANDILTRVKEVHKSYEELYDSLENKRTGKTKPKLVDKGLTDLLRLHFKRILPDNGQYGIVDINKLVPRALSLIIKENGLGDGQFFTLDNALKTLFECKSIADPSRTYLKCAQDRIADIRLVKGYKQSASSAEIYVDGDKITMNYSALKIIIPKFAIDYEITNPEKYIPELEEFILFLEKQHTQYKENKKAKKSSK